MNTQATPPVATVARKNSASVCRSKGMAISADGLVGDFGRVERGGEPLLLAVVARPFPEARPTDTGRAVASEQTAVRVLAEHLENENILGDDDVAFHAH